MKTFLQFISENLDLESLDTEFLKRAENITALNLNASDFYSKKHKKEIQYLFKKIYFPTLDLSETFKSESISVDDFNSFINKLKNISSTNYEKLFNETYNKAFGPGEVISYFAFDNCELGGGSKSKDIIFPSKSYEMKAGIPSGGFISDFKLGGTVPLHDVETKFFELAKKAGVFGTEISGEKTQTMKSKFPEEFAKIEKEYAEVCYTNYFEKHSVVFMGSKNASKAFQHKCIAVKDVKKNEIFIERYTSKYLKPKIKL